MTKHLKLLILLPILLLAGQAGANPHFMAVSAPTGQAETLQYNSDPAQDLSLQCRVNDGSALIAFKATVGSFGLTKIAVKVGKRNNPTQNYYMRVYSHNAGADEPDSLLTTSNALDPATFAQYDAPTYQEFLLATQYNLAAGTYWFVLYAANIDATHRVYVWFNAAGTLRVMYSDDAPVSWALSDGSMTPCLKLYGY